MKICILIALGLALELQAQSQPATETLRSVDELSSTRYEVGARGMNHRVWNKVTARTDALGGVSYTTNRAYVELATGLHFQDASGQWRETKEEFETVPGWAVARKGPHKLALAYNLNSAGAVAITMPDGHVMRAEVLGLSYLDPGTGQSVLLAGIKDCAGKVIPPNQVIYEDAFNDLKADVRFTYTKAGLEQDIILREQLPDPGLIGMNPATTRIVVMTEFIDPPPATTSQSPDNSAAGTNSLPDDQVNFGTMWLGEGRAFDLGQEGGAGGATTGHRRVGKKWTKIGGRTFLLEQIPVSEIQTNLNRLPKQASVRPRSSLKMLAQMELPERRHAQTEEKTLEIASSIRSQPGFVLDYVALNSGVSNYTFQGDMTYYINGSVMLQGACIFEGGAVLKFAFNGGVAAVAMGGNTPSISWKASAYRPVIFTVKDDNSVGEIISDSNGNPTNSNGSMLALVGVTPTPTLTGLRMSYGGTAVQVVSCSANIYDAQFVNCQNGVGLGGATVYLGNALFANTKNSFAYQGGSTVTARNVTFSGSSYLATAPQSYNGSSLYLLNCILANVTNLTNGVLTLSSTYGGFYSSPPFGNPQISASAYPFQGAGAGNYYLTSGSGFVNAGTTTGFDPTFLASLSSKTTQPPLVYSNLILTADTMLTPQAALDTGNLDLGYHYQPLDYLVDNVTMAGATLSVTNGVAIGHGNQPGIVLQSGGALVSTGTPQRPNWFVPYQSVQEQPIQLGGTNVSAGLPVGSMGGGTAAIRFSKFACPASGGYHLNDAAGSAFDNLVVAHCEFWGGLNDLTGSANTTATLLNNLFWRSSLNASAASLTSTLGLTNNLVYKSVVTLNQPANATWTAFNNSFDTCVLTNCTVTNGYNGYLGSTGRLYPTNSQDVVQTATQSYVSGKLGDFYQPGTSVLINKGNTTADQLGLYHFTTQSSQTKETTSTVDIGYHYVAVNGNGVPLDYDGDGLADYFEDTNGNGSNDMTDLSSWLSTDTDGDGVNDYLEYVLGRNLRAGASPDTGNQTRLIRYTPLR